MNVAEDATGPQGNTNSHHENTGAGGVSAALEARKIDVLHHLFPAGREVGHEFVVGSLGGEAGASLKVHLNGKGSVWCDFSTGDKGGDLLDLWAQARCGGNIGTAMREAADWLGLRNFRASPGGHPPRNGTRADGQQQTADTPNEWTYEDVDGEPWIKIVRNDLPEGGKFFRQYDCKRKQWIAKEGAQLPDPRPLYHLSVLAAAESVLFFEGEKCSEAVVSFDYCTTTTMGGALSPHKTDFSPLADKTVIIWRDNDDAGLRYQEAVAKLCLKAHARPYVLPIPEDKPPGWDSADAIADGWTREQVRDFLSQATPYEEKKILVAHDISRFLTLPIPPREQILSPVIETQGLGMMYSARGVGKTYVGLGLAYAVAASDAFLTWQAPTARRVLYVDGEMPAIVMQTRLASIIQGATKEPPQADYLKIITPDCQQRPIGNLSTPDGQAQIEEHLDGVALLILDNLSTLCRSGEENAAESWLPIQEWILGLRRKGLAILMLHHAGKNGAQRGTSKREDILDTVLCLKRPADYEPEEGLRLEVHLEKCRSIFGADAKPFEVRLHLSDNKATWEVVEVEADLVAQVTQRLREGATQRKIASEFGISIGKVNSIAKRARAAGGFV